MTQNLDRNQITKQTTQETEASEIQTPIVTLYTVGHDWSFPMSDLLRAYYPGKKIICHQVDQLETASDLLRYLKEKDLLETLDRIVYCSVYERETGLVMHRRLKHAKDDKNKGFTQLGQMPAHIASFGKDHRNYLKRELYYLLSKEYGELPWGMLTGVRPSSLLHNNLLKSFQAKDEKKHLTAHMLEQFCVSKPRAELAAEVAIVENPIIESAEAYFSLYINIPFCPTRCDYCSFPTLLSQNRKEEMREYAQKIVWEMRETAPLYQGRKLQNIYVGGGTPATLENEDMRMILEEIPRCFDTSKLLETTVEVGRPELITEELLSTLVSCGVDRISINPQTMQQKTLDLIGRAHTVDNVKSAFALTRAKTTLAINLDLIIGLPGEGEAEFRNTLQQVKMLAPENLTMHTMAIKKGSVYGQRGVDDFVTEIHRIESLCDIGRAFALKEGYRPYYLYRQKNMVAPLENVGYSKPGFINRYNILMMEEKHFVLGLGMGATSKFPIKETNGVKTILNYRNLRDYLGKTELKILEKKTVFQELNLRR